MAFRFRLTVAAKSPGTFRFEKESIETTVGAMHVTLTARDTETLAKSRKVHFEAGGFESEASAREAGERLRLRLRMLNALLNLGLIVPVTDKVTGSVSTAIKNQFLREHGVTIMDNIFGLSVCPDDGKHVEHVTSTHGSVYPTKPEYVLDVLGKLWNLEIRLDSRSEDALSVLAAATLETSDRAAFLLTYLALESLVERAERSEAAKELLRSLVTQVEASELPPNEIVSLTGVLGSLHEESFSSALKRYASTISPAPSFDGMPLSELVSKSIGLRHAIAHQAVIASDVDIRALGLKLRQFVIGIIWSLNGLADLSYDRPGDTIIFEDGLKMRFL